MTTTETNYDLLKQVLIRADYSDIVQLQCVLRALLDDKHFVSRFCEHKVINEKLSSNDDGRYKEYHRFIEDIENGALFLDLSDDCCIVNARIGSEKYNAGHYGELLSRVLSVIKSVDPFVRTTRIGVRKIYSKDCVDGDNPDAIFKFFDQKLIDGENEFFLERNYSETLGRKDDSFQINYSRVAKFIKSDSSFYLRFTLDIDVFCEDEQQLEKTDLSTMMATMESISWEMYIRSLKNHYIKKIQQYEPMAQK